MEFFIWRNKVQSVNNIITTTIDHLLPFFWQLFSAAPTPLKVSTRRTHSDTVPGSYCHRIISHPRNVAANGSWMVLDQLSKGDGVGLPIPVPLISCASEKQHAVVRCRVESKYSSVARVSDPVQPGYASAWGVLVGSHCDPILQKLPV